MGSMHSAHIAVRWQNGYFSYKHAPYACCAYVPHVYKHCVLCNAHAPYVFRIPNFSIWSNKAFFRVNVHCIWRGLAKLLNNFIFNTKQQWRLYGACLRSFVMHNCAHICRCLYSMQLSGFHTVNFILEAMSLKRQCHKRDKENARTNTKREGDRLKGQCHKRIALALKQRKNRRG